MKKGGAAVAGPIFNAFMNEALKVMPDESFEKPDLATDPTLVKPILRGFWQGNENFFIDKVSGKLATPNTPKEALVEKVITNVHSILYWVDKNNITGPAPSDPNSSSQFNHWEIPVQTWWAQNKDKYAITTLSDKPTAVDDVHVGTILSSVSIIEPNAVTIYQPTQKIYLNISNSGPFPLQKIDIFINGTFVETDQYPFNFSFIPEELDNLQENNELKIVSYDTAYNRNQTTLIFKVKQ